MTTKAEITEILTVLSAAWPRYQMTKETITAYYSFLKDIPADDLRAAAARCAATKDFFPSVHELRQAVVENVREAQRIPTPYEAWAEVCRRSEGDYHSRVVEENGEYIIEKIPNVPWSHPIVEKVAIQMGWPKFPSSDEIGVDRAHFVRAYEYALDAALRDGLQLPEVRRYIEARSGSGPISITDFLRLPGEG